VEQGRGGAGPCRPSRLDERRIFSVLVWPPLELERPEAYEAHDERVEEVIEAISRGAAEKRWTSHWHVDDGLRWDDEREAWVAGDGFAYTELSREEGDSSAEAEGAA
jgi:hypothetical protein